jgi:hypothetical protein
MSYSVVVGYRPSTFCPRKPRCQIVALTLRRRGRPHQSALAVCKKSRLINNITGAGWGGDYLIIMDASKNIRRRNEAVTWLGSISSVCHIVGSCAVSPVKEPIFMQTVAKSRDIFCSRITRSLGVSILVDLQYSLMELSPA